MSGSQALQKMDLTFVYSDVRTHDMPVEVEMGSPLFFVVVGGCTFCMCAFQRGGGRSGHPLMKGFVFSFWTESFAGLIRSLPSSC